MATISPAPTIDTREQLTTYEIDPAHTVAEFSVKHLMVTNVKGQFTQVSGQLQFDETDPTRSLVSATAEAASVDTREPQRDEHLRSVDFFDVEHFAIISFISRRVERTRRPDAYRVVGDLTIRGVTREVVFDTTYVGKATDPWGNTRIGINATTTVNRKDFGLHWNMALEAGGVLVGDTVKISLDVEAVQRNEVALAP